MSKRRGGLMMRIKAMRACEECADSGGLWRRADNGGSARCGCVRGKLLAKLDAVRAKKRSRSEVEV